MKTFLSIVLMLTMSYAYGQNNILNVTNYGAVGDAVQFYVNTISNSVLVTTTNQLPGTSIGDAIEIFQAGAQTYGVNSYGANGYGNQDLVAVITDVVNGTNIYISLSAENTLTNAFATFGHNNRANIQSALNAAGTNTTIYIPAGTYLILTDSNSPAYGYFGLALNHGGITLDGAGPTATRILSQGAWTTRLLNGNPGPWRGVLFEEDPPIANNNLPFVLENMTLDGGVQQGNTSIHGIYANPVDGLGWDTTHDAFLEGGNAGGSVFNQMTWTNLVFQHWRGEMVKSIDQSTNGNLYVVNCAFNDGDATAINIYPSINFTNCEFNNLFQVAEYYQAYSTNTCYFQNNLVTNITGNGFAINGGKGNNPNFIIRNNTFYFPGNGYNGIETVPADNVLIQSNLFICQNYANVIALGCAGYQGTFDNSNIVITANTIINPTTFVEISGGASSTDRGRVESVYITNNFIPAANVYPTYLVQTFGWCTNIVFRNNIAITNGTDFVCASGEDGAPFINVETNDVYYFLIYDLSGKTNFLDFANGSRYQIIYGYTANSVYALVNTDSNQIPAGAQMLVYNNSSGNSAPFYFNSALSGGSIIIPAGQTFVATWTNNAWVSQGLLVGLSVPNPEVGVSTSSLTFGNIPVGATLTNQFVVQNIGGGILSGSASVGAPYSILSGGSYNLSSNQSQTVTVVFSPAASGSYNQSVTLTGGNGTNVTLFGSATNLAYAIPPTVSPISANAINLGSNPAVLILNPGTVQLSATASAYQNDPISWQWEDSVNGGPQTVYSVGSSTNPVANLVNTANTGGNTNVWTLKVTDTNYGLSAQSQITTVVVLPPPLSMQIGLHASIN